MALKLDMIDSGITTEVSRPFSNTISQSAGRFYYDRAQRSSTTSMTNGHYHNMYEIYFLALGRCRYFIGNKLFEVEAGDLVLIPRGTIHKTIYLNTATDRHLLNFSASYIPPSLLTESRSLFEQTVYRPSKSLLPDIASIFGKIAAEHRKSDAYSKLLLSGYMTELFSLMLRNPSSGGAGRRTDTPIERATQYISANYQSPLTLEQVAAQVSLSPSYFSRLFKSTTGFGFKEYLTLLRLKQAQTLLIHTDLSICEIAYECGFNDSNYFSSVFREFNDISPLNYRKKKHGTSEK
ncbi:MAG: helix-turn-helix transcriptional regulator [Oscillospiraceae bacterium]|nr:helix-turn-helix transcriptional regulator [Oscillospiraceae bacterium]